MKTVIISVGKKNDSLLESAISDYSERLNRAMPTNWELIAPCGFDEPKARQYESAAILAKLKPSDVVWLLDERGKQLTSPALAAQINVLQYQGVQRLVMVIGGAYGVDEALRARANYVWSLSELVFPHQLVRLLLAEQLYRAIEINRGSGYHHV
jgi:23S rRNA (pseudouridine1915-N3)-methyltransferase